MLAVGVTGGIGSGKSLVCDVFRSLHIPVYQADQEARRIMVEHREIRMEIIRYFGEEAISGTSLNRSFLAARIFPDAQARTFLNALVHPAVREDFKVWAGNRKNVPYVIEEAALLFESNAYRELDITVLVTAPLEMRIARIKARDKLKHREILARMNSQMKPEAAGKLADYIIRNDEQRFILPQVLEIHQNIVMND